MQDVMVDLETLGTVPGCVLVSIGAVAFNPRNGDLHAEGFYRPLFVKEQEQIGLHVCPKTEAWWAQQSEQARAVFADWNRVSLQRGLAEFNDYIGQFDDVRVWGNGADFDNALLAAAYRAAGVSPGWKPYNGRCYRTVKNLAPHIKMVRSGTHHNALDDARSQAEHLMEIVKATTLTLA